MFRAVAVLLVLACLASGTHAILCLRGSGVTLNLLKEAITCQEGQTCFVETTMPFDGGALTYTAGCRDISLCKIEGCSTKETTNIKEVGNITEVGKRADKPMVLCSECCYHSLCNMKGCGGTFGGNNQSIQCFQCKEIFGDRNCTTFKACEATEVCWSEKIDPARHPADPNAVDLGCGKRRNCEFLKKLYINQNTPLEHQNVQCCDNDLCNWKPLDNTSEVESIANKLTCPPDLVEPTGNTETSPITNTQRTTTMTPSTTPTQAPTTTSTTSTPSPTTTTSTTTPSPTTTTTTMTPAPTTTTTTTKPWPETETTTVNPLTNSATTSTPAPTTTTTTTTPAPTTTTTTTTPAPTTTTTTTTPAPTTTTDAPATQTTEPPPFQLGTQTTKCHLCSGPAQICEQVHASRPCVAPNNYCINHVTNHLDGTRSVNRTCGNFNTCYREWYLGTSDEDKCDVMKNNQHVDFQCTFCCINDNCNIPLRPAENTLYKPRMIG